MSGKWLVFAVVLAVTTTLINTAIFVGQFSSPASARVSGANSSKLLEDEDFVDSLTNPTYSVGREVRDGSIFGPRNCGNECSLEFLA
jgi:hypothetical protein